MCGFVGFIDQRDGRSAEAAAQLIEAMAEVIAHRGPDDAYSFIDTNAGLALGFRRLAIQDLTHEGRQPMQSLSGRHVLVFNGEIYNAPELRRELVAQGASFRGHSDTEIMLEAFERWGVAQTLPRLSGMFALALWDRKDRFLLLARDPMGKKPLYYGIGGTTVFFGSQPKAFRPHPKFNAELDRDSLCAFLRFGYVPAPHSIFSGLRQLRPGECVGIAHDGTIGAPTRFFDLAAVAAQATRERNDISDDEALDSLDRILGEAVDRRLISDVPLGAFLSGGIDSSLIVALMQARQTGRVQTFSVGFTEAAYDESGYAAAVAAHLGTEHHALRVSPEEVRAAIPAMPTYFDEPFADASQVPTYLLSAFTRRHVTVALSGDGGDELFGGYRRYRHALDILALTARVPAALHPLLAAGLRATPCGVLNALGPLLPARFGRTPLAGRVRRLAAMLGPDGLERIYRDLVGQWPDPESLVVGGREPVDPIWTGALAAAVPEFGRRMQLIDALTYLPDDILVKIDRASMAVGLEARAPLLDTQVAAFAWSLPNSMIRRDGQEKWLLRRLLARHIPQELIDRPKMGFMFPLAEWLRGPLRDWAGDLLSPAALAQDGVLRPEPIARLWREHESGAFDWSYRLWCVLMFQAWRRAWLA